MENFLEKTNYTIYDPLASEELGTSKLKVNTKDRGKQEANAKAKCIE